MWYVKEDINASDLITVVTAAFIRPWMVMLALGGIGHRTDRPQLFLNYWTVWLAIFAIRMIIGHVGTTKYKAAQTRRELK